MPKIKPDEKNWIYINFKVPPELKSRYAQLTLELYETGHIDRPTVAILYRAALRQYLESLDKEIGKQQIALP